MKDSVSDTDKALVECKAEDNVIAMYLDAQLFKKIGNKDKYFSILLTLGFF